MNVPDRSLTVTHATDRQRLARPKTERAQRTLALADLAVRTLELRRAQEAGDRLMSGNRRQETGIVFANPTGGIRDGCAVRRTVQRVLVHNGLRPIRCNALRRVFAAIPQDQGIPLERTRDFLRDAELRTPDGYAYALPERLRRDIVAIDTGLNESTGEGRT